MLGEDTSINSRARQEWQALLFDGTISEDCNTSSLTTKP